MKDVVKADTLIGKPVLSKVSGNKLGEVADLYIDPIKGLLMGLTINNSKDRLGGLDFNDVYSFGEDAVMAEGDDRIVPLDENWVKTHPHAKKHLTGINVVTESGNLIGKVTDIYIRLASPPVVIYEVGETVLDRWLGRDFFIPASSGTAVSNNAERIVVSDEAAKTAAPTLKALFSGENAHLPNDNRAVSAAADNRNNFDKLPADNRIENPVNNSSQENFDARTKSPLSRPLEEEKILRQRNKSV